MHSNDPILHATLAFAQERIRATADAAVVEVANRLLMLMKSASTYRERGQLAFAQIHILENRELLLATFASALDAGIAQDVATEPQTRQGPANTDWQSISLVDEGQIEEKISFERVGQLIAHRCEAELRDLDALMSGLLRHGWADPRRNPLRGAILGSALHKAIDKITDEPDTQKIFGRELGQALANAMPSCYREIVVDLERRGVKKTDLAMRPVDDASGRANARTSAKGDDVQRAWEQSWIGRMPADAPPLRSWEASILGRFHDIDPLPADANVESSAALLEQWLRGKNIGTSRADGGARSPGEAAADLELMNLLRRLNGGRSYMGEFDALPRDTGYGSYIGEPAEEFATTRPGVPLGIAFEQPPSDGLGGLVAANLIRAHRAELLRATRGKLDHLVIEVVASLFDQILSDVRVPPEMARQIARLQLPVLRAALVDSSFFSSRRHPVRRFINRVASLACAFDTFESGPAKELLDRTRQLVDEIVDGDFDQLDLYDAKLLQLERFVADQTHAEIRASAAAATLRGKELEWRVQQRFGQQLRSALEPLALPGFLRDFLTGAWAQAIVMATRRDGANADYPKRLRKSGAELAMSVQPKRSIEERRQFVANLPALMAELTQAMKFVDWPPSAQDEFFGQLVTQHAGSLKGAPRSDLDHNMMLRNLDAAFRTPVPTADEAAAAEPPPVGVAPLPVVEQQFSLDEELAIGLVSEHEVDWSRDVTPTTSPSISEHSSTERASVPSLAAVGGDDGERARDGDAPLPNIDFDVASAAPTTIDEAPIELPEAPELAAGPQLREHLQLGFSYQLNLKNEWQKVRLTYMSPARSLFLFSHGAKGRETISMTARTLGRLCAAGRMRAFENAFLIERATARAHKQLAAVTSRSARRPS